MRKEIVSVHDAKQHLTDLGYVLSVRKGPGCHQGAIRLRTTKGQPKQEIGLLSRPTPAMIAEHPALFAWLAEHAIADGPHIIVL